MGGGGRTIMIAIQAMAPRIIGTGRLANISAAMPYAVSWWACVAVFEISSPCVHRHVHTQRVETGVMMRCGFGRRTRGGRIENPAAYR